MDLILEVKQQQEKRLKKVNMIKQTNIIILSIFPIEKPQYISLVLFDEPSLDLTKRA